MRLLLAVQIFGVGLLIALHFSMNSAVGGVVQNPRMGNALFWLIGAFVAVLIGLTGWDSTVFTSARNVPVWLWAAGAIGATMVFVIVATIPKLGAASTNIALLAGQVIGGMIIGHYGLLGSPVEACNTTRVVGALITILGATLVVLGRVPLPR